MSPSAPALLLPRRVRDQVSAEEWEARVDLAAAYRLAAVHGMTEGIANHISCRVPGTHDHFLINPFGMLYEEITASSLIKIDVDGSEILNPTEYGVNKAGFVIHSAIHLGRPDAICVAHTHTQAGMAVSALACGLMPLAQSGMRFAEIAYHDFEGIADDADERQRLVADLGAQDAMILRNHGLLVTGRSVGMAFNLLFRLERACQTQLLALACNSPLAQPHPGVLKATYTRMKSMHDGTIDQLAWSAFRRKLDLADRSYQD